jgi:8-oxo-dGTP pyrophosphatase MutT (NUDIX family)
MSLAQRLRAAIAAPGIGVQRGDWDFTGNGPHEPRELTPAAVLIAVVDRPAPSLLLTRRNAALRRHAGQVAFPGGRIDPEDANPVAAALREAQEEVALPPHAVEIIGITDVYETGTCYHITPVLGIIAPDLPLVAAADEVAAVFEVPLAFLLDPANHQLRQSEWQGKTRFYYVIGWPAHEIWGATAAMIVNLARRLA